MYKSRPLSMLAGVHAILYISIIYAVLSTIVSNHQINYDHASTTGLTIWCRYYIYLLYRVHVFEYVAQNRRNDIFACHSHMEEYDQKTVARMFIMITIQPYYFNSQ